METETIKKGAKRGRVVWLGLRKIITGTCTREYKNTYSGKDNTKPGRQEGLKGMGRTKTVVKEYAVVPGDAEKDTME